ncbi:uncharacterized protein [Asterias amurensis]|uniref:uncharacterized protein n=1 Tax=Asterias amurensis TaxID=7602 RepID=UPI003AB12559
MMTIDQTLKRDLLKSTTPAATSEKETREDSQSDVANLDQHIVASSKQVLLKSIDFRPAEQDVSFQLQNLRVKYVALNPSCSGGEDTKQLTSNNHSQMNGQVEVKQDGIPAPKKVLYPPDKIVLAWQRSQRVGPGLINMGNTCFLNATLQCLTYTPPLANYLLSHQHKTECRELGFCIMCELCNHVHRAFIHQQNGQAIRPMVILHKLKYFAKHMHIGRQEDAHEFLRLLIEAMQKTCVNGFDKLDKYSKETSLVYQIFSGYYRSRVICSVCQNKSDTYEPFLDIGLDIKQAPTVTKALERLIRPEMLDGENLYQCKKCNRKVQAQKRFTVQRAPHVLTLCLKRFDFNRFSTGKINKELNYSDHLNLRPYMSDPKGPAIMYELYAVLKHEGASCNSGHYYCFVKAANQSWYCMNDAFVSQVSLQRVLNQNAYLLFYIRKSSFKSPMNGGEPKRDVVQNNRSKPATTISKPQSLFNGPLGTPVSRPLANTLHQKSPVFKPTMISEGKDNRPLKLNQSHQQQQQEAKHKLTPLPAQRNKLSFQFRNKSANVVTANSQPPPQQQQQQQPLLVKKQDTNATAAAASVNTPVVTGGGDATPQIHPEQTAATKTFSPPQNQTSPPTIASSTTQSKDSLKHMQGLVKPKARLPQDASKMNGVCKKQPASSGLVPYTAEDSNSSSGDSEMDYDNVVAQFSMSQGGDASNQSKNSNKKPQVKSEEPPKGDVCISNDSKENPVDATPMKPPATAKSLSLDNLQLSPNLLKKAGLANSTNLTSIRKPDSPLKLTITTNGQAQRIKSTSHWRAADSDSQISPSPASDCSLHSNVSTNSTSEWNILEKRDAPQTPQDMKKEAAVFGWNISPAPPLKNSEKPPDSEEQRTKLIGPKIALVFDDVKDESPDRTKVHEKQKKIVSGDKQEVSIKSESVSIKNENKSSTHKDVKHQKVLERSNLKDDGQQDTVYPKLSNEQTFKKDTKEELEENLSPKKKKKRKKDRSHPGSPEEPESSSKVNECKGQAKSERSKVRDIEENRENDVALQKHKKKKKKKKKNKEKREYEEEELVEEWVERVIEPHQDSDKEPLLSNSKVSNHDSDRDYHDKHKTSKKRDSEEIKHKHSTPHTETKRKDKHFMMQRALEKKLKRHHERRASQKHKKDSSKHDDHNIHEDHHQTPNSSRDVPHNGDTSHKYSKHHKESRKRHSSDDRSSSDYSTKVRRIDRDDHLTSNREKHSYKIDKSDRHSHSSDNHSTSKKPYKGEQLRSEDDPSPPKEKKKKRKHRDEESERRSLKDHNDEESKPEKRKKKKKKHSSSDDEEDRSSRVTSQKSRQDVPVQQWDHHIKDSHKKRDKEGGDDETVGKSSKTHTSWDGTYSSSSVAEELNKSSLKAFGPSILSWDGGRSALDNEVDSDSRQNRQRDPYEEDFDRGKIKKVKKYLEEGKQKLFGGRNNPFQSIQTTRNRFEKDHHGYNRLSQSYGERPR